VHARLIVLSTSALTALVLSAPAVARTSASPCASGNVVSTASYRLALDIGGKEEMYLPSEIKARHITDGEVMLGGEMSMVERTAGTRIYHLEVHICNKAGIVVTKLKPLIVVDSAMLPAAIMRGIGEPMSDYHYGNDIALKPGARIMVKVTVKGQVARFHATVPKL
jgi:hypothetical protein